MQGSYYYRVEYHYPDNFIDSLSSFSLPEWCGAHSWTSALLASSSPLLVFYGVCLLRYTRVFSCLQSPLTLFQNTPFTSLQQSHQLHQQKGVVAGTNHSQKVPSLFHFSCFDGSADLAPWNPDKVLGGFHGSSAVEQSSSPNCKDLYHFSVVLSSRGGNNSKLGHLGQIELSPY